MPKTIAIVEDEAAIRANYSEALERQGYAVTGYANRREALAGFQGRLPDLVLLDIGLEDEIDGGFELCRQLRARAAQLPIIFLTARDSDYDAIAGLRLGADDYLSKDVSLPQLSARIAALFRRLDALRTPQDPSRQLQRGPLRLDMDRLEAHWHDRQVPLTLTELWMVHALARFPGHVKNRDQLMHEADVVVDAGTVTTHVKRIRAKFLECDPGFDAIETVYGMGYRWNEHGAD